TASAGSIATRLRPAPLWTGVGRVWHDSGIRGFARAWLAAGAKRVGWVERSDDPTPAEPATCVASSLTLDATSYEASLVKLRVIWSTVSDLSHLFDPPGSIRGPEGAWRGRPAGWVDGVQGRPADHLLSVPACVAGHPIPRAP